jgi:hypothetical protein
MVEATITAPSAVNVQAFFLHPVQFPVFVVSMDFPQEIKKFSAADIVRVVGCPERTAYSWIMGEKFPPEWAQVLVLRALKRTRSTRR